MLSEKVIRPHVRSNRPILILSVPVTEGIEIRHGCQFLSRFVRALAKLPGGIGSFLPCRLGSHISRLRHLGWSQCSHGLTSRPLESCHHQCLKAVCGVLEYPKGSAAELSDGTLKLRHCTTFLPRVFPFGLYLGLGMVVVNGRLLLLVVLKMLVVIWIKGSGLPGRHVQVHLLMSIRIQGIQRRPWGWVRFALGMPGTCSRRLQA